MAGSAHNSRHLIWDKSNDIRNDYLLQWHDETLVRTIEPADW